MAVGTYREDDLGRRWDRCLTDGVLKFGGGLLVGTLMSVLFLKKTKWPILLGAGFGVGMAFKNCESEINESVTGGCQKK